MAKNRGLIYADALDIFLQKKGVRCERGENYSIFLRCCVWFLEDHIDIDTIEIPYGNLEKTLKTIYSFR